MKRLFGKVGLGSRFGTFFGAMAMILREDKQLMIHKDAIEAGVVSYLKETNKDDCESISGYKMIHEFPDRLGRSAYNSAKKNIEFISKIVKSID